MEIDRKPQPLPYHTDDSWWHLLRGDAGELYILVHCEASFVGYDRLIKLNDAELLDFRGMGWLSLQHLANRINYFVDEYHGRHVGEPELSSARKAIEQSRQ